MKVKEQFAGLLAEFPPDDTIEVASGQTILRTKISLYDCYRNTDGTLSLVVPSPAVDTGPLYHELRNWGVDRECDIEEVIRHVVEITARNWFGEMINHDRGDN